MNEIRNWIYFRSKFDIESFYDQIIQYWTCFFNQNSKTFEIFWLKFDIWSIFNWYSTSKIHSIVIRHSNYDQNLTIKLTPIEIWHWNYFWLKFDKRTISDRSKFHIEIFYDQNSTLKLLFQPKFAPFEKKIRVKFVI